MNDLEPEYVEGRVTRHATFEAIYDGMAVRGMPGISQENLEFLTTRVLAAVYPHGLKQPAAPPKYDPRAFALVEMAYMALLKLPHGYTRLCLQPVLAGLRDQLAVMRGLDSEAIQTEYEEGA